MWNLTIPTLDGTEPLPESEHLVQFYQEDFVSEAVAAFLARGLAGDEPVVVIASPEHWAAISAQLPPHGYDLAAALRTDAVTVYDADQTLASVMAGDRPDAGRFTAVMEGILRRAWRGRAVTRIRAFGEMVDLLCARGNHAGAVQLEGLWNELARTHPIALLCAYSMGNLYREVNGAAYERICACHTQVIPA